MPVVVVESPAKAKTINKYLGDDYTVLASFGHVRDLHGGGAPRGDDILAGGIQVLFAAGDQTDAPAVAREVLGGGTADAARCAGDGDDARAWCRHAQISRDGGWGGFLGNAGAGRGFPGRTPRRITKAGDTGPRAAQRRAGIGVG